MSRQKPKVAVGLLTGHTILRVRYVKTRTHTEAGLPTMWGRRRSVHIVCHFPTLARKCYRNWSRVLLMPKGLENMRVN